MAADELNEEGPLAIGPGLYNLRVVSADETLTTGGAAQAALKLVEQERVKFIIGPIGSVAALATQEITEPNHVLRLTGTWVPQVIGPDKPFTFRIVPTINETVAMFYAWVRQNYPQVKTVAITNMDNVEGHWATERTVKEAKKQGLQVVAQEFYPPGTSDFNPLLTRILERQPDMVDLSAASPLEIGLQLKQLHELGYQGLRITPGGADPRIVTFLAGGSEPVEGFVTAYLDWEGPYATQGMKDFRRRAEAKYGADKWDPMMWLTYEATRMLIQAMQAAGSTDPDKVKDALEGIEYESLAGPFHFGGQKTYGARRQVIMPVYLSQFREGKLVTLLSQTPEVP